MEPGTPVEIGDALAEVVSANRPVTLQELPAGAGLDAMMVAAGVRSLMASPLVIKGRLAGVVEVAMRAPRPFTLEEESLLILMADRAGLAIEHARAYEREVSNVEMLQRSLLPQGCPTSRESRSAPATSPAAPTWAATGTTPSRSRAAGWAWRWATWWDTGSARPR